MGEEPTWIEKLFWGDPHAAREAERMRAFAAERLPAYIATFIRCMLQPGQVVSPDPETNIKFWIKGIDEKLSSQLREILHHPDLQRLEATWRGLHYLASRTQTGDLLKIRVLNVTRAELSADLDRAAGAGDGALVRLLVEEEYDRPGGEPYGLLVGDYEFGPGPEDVALLEYLSHIAASALAPFVAAASPRMFRLDRWVELARPSLLAQLFEGAEYAAWRSFRQSEDSRYVALTLPRVLARAPFGANSRRVEAFDFEEVEDDNPSDPYLWMNAAWAYAACVTRAFAAHGWLARTRGLEGGGKVEGLAVPTRPTDSGDVTRCSTEVAMNDRREYELSNLGFLPLLHTKDIDNAVFMGAQSCHKPQRHSDPCDNASAELSAKFNMLLCVVRFAHCLRVMARDRVGPPLGTGDYERWFNDWLSAYVLTETSPVPDEERDYLIANVLTEFSAEDHERARRPLAAARVEVREAKGRPGRYAVSAYLTPTYQFACLTMPLRLVMEIRA
jgi:type VI secretion system protein ImpC